MTLTHRGPSSWTGVRENVDEMLRRHDPFESIVAYINAADLNDDHKAALWLLVFSEQPLRLRRRFTKETLTGLARPQG
jgi:hypothetical protein